MTDIVERLLGPHGFQPECYALRREAAAEIKRLHEHIRAVRAETADEVERLRRELDVEKAMVAFHQKNEQVKNAEIERLAAAHREIEVLDDLVSSSDAGRKAIKIARRALEGK